MTTIRLVQCAPTLMSAGGDSGNITAAAERLRAADISVQTSIFNPGQNSSPPPADVIVIGNGPLSAIRTLLTYREELSAWLKAQYDEGAVILAVAGGAELLAREITDLNGTTTPGLGLLPMHVQRTQERAVGYIVLDTPDEPVVGFEDHASNWTVESVEATSSAVRFGRGSVVGREQERRDLIVAERLYATGVTGPLLPLNPQLTDSLLSTITAARGCVYRREAAGERFDTYVSKARAAIERLAVDKRYRVIDV